MEDRAGRLRNPGDTQSGDKGAIRGLQGTGWREERAWEHTDRRLAQPPARLITSNQTKKSVDKSLLQKKIVLFPGENIRTTRETI